MILYGSSSLIRKGDRRDPQKVFELVKANQAFWPIATQCRVLGVSLSGYYAWRARPPSKRAKVDAELKAHIKAFHTRSDGTYGAPRIWKDLMDIGIRVGKKRVARLMSEMGICGVSRRKGIQTTVKAHLQTVLRGSLRSATIACCVVVRVTSCRVTCVRRIAVRLTPIPGSATSVFELPGLFSS